jgi:3-carboxy-cis,cis-muconate cycloisomerase
MALADIFRAPWDAGEATDAAFSDRALLGRMLAFEGALARALAEADVVPHAAAEAAASLCEHWAQDGGSTVPGLAPDQLAASGRRAGSVAIPFVKALTEAVAREDAQAARCIHRGATSQDVIDTALVLEAREVIWALLVRLEDAAEAAARLAQAHRDTPMAGRTLLQAAVPISFGWKAAGWLAGLQRSIERIERTLPEACRLQFGGAAGTLSSLGDRAQPVARALARHLDLPLPATSWHSLRDSLAALAAEVGIACGVLGKIGADIALLMQSEVAEAFEPHGEGRGGSSAMPHKRNPVGAMLSREAALRAPGLVAALLAGLPAEHERGVGGWQRDWFTWRDLAGAAAAAPTPWPRCSPGCRSTRRGCGPTSTRWPASRSPRRSRPTWPTASGGPPRRRASRSCAARPPPKASRCRRRPCRGRCGRARLRRGPAVPGLRPAAHLGGARAMTDAALAQWRSRLATRAAASLA